MADNSVNTAVISRWSVKGLDSTVATLYLGTEGDPQHYINEISKAMSEGSGPNEEPLPRARFVNFGERLVKKTATCRVIRCDVMFYLFGVSMDWISTKRVLVNTVFENGHAQVAGNADPFSISGASVSDLDLIEFEEHPERHDIKYCEILYGMTFSVPRNLSWPVSVP